ncbi:hypothetical protein NPIL_568601 [Nephila pilipes]|uniref:GATA-type domain-containing protein n=1 Tax=Nephila pilipes TaxID=299642 RepID=A0A8X6T485_NEPPI|nr:hypothetical protein NPIL_568601 [Nephila pilipes]
MDHKELCKDICQDAFRKTNDLDPNFNLSSKQNCYSRQGKIPGSSPNTEQSSLAKFRYLSPVTYSFLDTTAQISQSPPELIYPFYNRPQYQSLISSVVSPITSSTVFQPSSYSNPEQNSRKCAQLSHPEINTYGKQRIPQPSETLSYLSQSRPNATANSQVSSAITSSIDIDPSSCLYSGRNARKCAILYHPEIKTYTNQGMYQPPKIHSYLSLSEPIATANSQGGLNKQCLGFARDSLTSPKSYVHSSSTTKHDENNEDKIEIVDESSGNSSKNVLCSGHGVPETENSVHFNDIIGIPFSDSNEVAKQQNALLNTDKKKKVQIDKQCSNCKTRITSTWRRYTKADIQCNACYLYEKTNQKPRPIKMRKDILQIRKKGKYKHHTFLSQTAATRFPICFDCVLGRCRMHQKQNESDVP